MLVPSVSVFVAGLVAMAIVAALDWYVWGLNLQANPRKPERVMPLSGLELVDLGLGRLIATNEAVLPKAAFAAVHRDDAATTTDPGDGFKRVA